jgi:hypothetical protein
VFAAHINLGHSALPKIDTLLNWLIILDARKCSPKWTLLVGGFKHAF